MMRARLQDRPASRNRPSSAAVTAAGDDACCAGNTHCPTVVSVGRHQLLACSSDTPALDKPMRHSPANSLAMLRDPLDFVQGGLTMANHVERGFAQAARSAAPRRLFDLTNGALLDNQLADLVVEHQDLGD